MITNRKILKEYISLDRKRYNYSLSNYIRSTFLFQDRAHAIKLLRRLRITEYFFNKRDTKLFVETKGIKSRKSNLLKDPRILLGFLPTSAGDVRDTGAVPVSGRSPRGGHGTHSSMLACIVPWTESLAGYSP